MVDVIFSYILCVVTLLSCLIACIFAVLIYTFMLSHLFNFFSPLGKSCRKGYIFIVTLILFIACSQYATQCKAKHSIAFTS